MVTTHRPLPCTIRFETARHELSMVLQTISLGDLGHTEGETGMKRLRQAVTALRFTARFAQGLALYLRYRQYTMVGPFTYALNVALCTMHAPSGCIVECGVWRGGMSAGLADALPGRRHFLFDSFLGLPPAQEVDRKWDGQSAIEWQAAHKDNLRADPREAEQAMTMSNAGNYTLVPGWFKNTLPVWTPEPIAVLRLDGDWYESTMQCLETLYPCVVEGGLIVVDDYYHWEGCARALHDYFSGTKARERICGTGQVCFLVKLGC
jgi:O-methyltransferase